MVHMVTTSKRLVPLATFARTQGNQVRDEIGAIVIRGAFSRARFACYVAMY